MTSDRTVNAFIVAWGFFLGGLFYASSPFGHILSTTIGVVTGASICYVAFEDRRPFIIPVAHLYLLANIGGYCVVRIAAILVGAV